VHCGKTSAHFIGLSQTETLPKNRDTKSQNNGPRNPEFHFFLHFCILPKAKKQSKIFAKILKANLKIRKTKS